MHLPKFLPWLAVLLGLACSDREPAPPPPPSPFRKVTLDDAPGEPIGLAVLPDGRVLHTTRRGTVWLHALDGTKSVAAEIPVYTHDEDGLQGIAIDPSFAVEPWVYVYYAPPLETAIDDPTTLDVDEGAAPVVGDESVWAAFRGHNRLSRFRFDGSALELTSEQVLLEVAVDRGICCHAGGQIDFDGAGNLYLSTGDDTNPFMSDDFTPIDERPDRNPALDAQRSAANTADLRGKLLRIRVESDGTVTIPEGNLFPPGMSGTRPEIYAMGLRNPYRFSVNRSTGEVYLADYAPDARTSDPARGPEGNGKWLVVRAPANYGWPYCVGERAYVDYDFATEASSAPFDCVAPRNESPRNTGLVELPAVTVPELAYTYGSSDLYPELGSGGVGPMAGPVYVFDPNGAPGVRWPAEYDGGVVFYEWTRDFVAVLRLGADGALESLERLPSNVGVDSPIDAEFGPDGALYVLEYGDGYFRENPDAQLSRIEYVGPSEAP